MAAKIGEITETFFILFYFIFSFSFMLHVYM